MIDSNRFKFNFRKYLDIFLSMNLFLVIFSSLFFAVALIMEINGKSSFLNFFRRLWQPVILPSISILISSTLVIGVISWLKRKLLLESEDI